MRLARKSPSEKRAHPRCVASILTSTASCKENRVSIPVEQNLQLRALPHEIRKKLARVHTVRRIVRAGVYATRLLQMGAEIAGSRFLLHGCLLAPGMFRIIGHHFEGMQIDIAVGAIARAEAAADAPILDDYFQGISAADRADGAADHAQ